MKNIVLCFIICVVVAYADTPWSPNVRVSTDEPWDTLNQGESCFAVFGDTIVSICNTAERGSVPVAPYAYSFDGGQTFTQIPFTDYSTGIGWHTDPIIGFDDSGYVHMLIQYSAVFMNHYLSKDGGLSWVDTTRINSINGADKPWWVINDNEIYVVWQRTDPAWDIWLAKSTDYGASFSDSMIWTRAGITAICMDEQEHLHLALVQGFASGHLFYRKSTDYGETWTDEEHLSSTFYIEDYGDRAPINSITARGDVVFVTWVDNSFNGSWDIKAVRSTDGGTSWGTPFVVNDSTDGGQCKGWAHFDVYGGLHVIYYHTPDWPVDSATSLFSLRYQYSADSGATFYPSIRISDTASISHDRFLGEYHVIQSDSQYLYAIWTDGRNGDDNDLYFSKALLTDVATMEYTSPTYNDSLALFHVPTIWNGKVVLEITQQPYPVDIKIYDVLGRVVRHLFTGTVLSPMQMTLESKDFPVGILFLHGETEHGSEVTKVVNCRGR